MKSIMKAATGVLLAGGLAIAASSPARAAVDFWIGFPPPPPPPPVIYPAPYYVPPPCYAYGPYACPGFIHYRPHYRHWGPRWWRPARSYW